MKPLDIHPPSPAAVPVPAGATSMTAGAQQTGVSPALDRLRWMAAAAMVFNHVGVRLLADDAQRTGLTGLLVFIGSLAPVLFFFATGFGVGLRVRKPATWWDGLDKAAWLLLADAFFAWQSQIAWGFNFFGFIAISMVATGWLARSRHAVPLACAAMLMLLALRFGLAKPLMPVAEQQPLLAWLVGMPAVDNVSYPLSPWGIYPLAGFVLARLWQRCRPGATRSIAVLGAVAVVVTAAGLAGAAHGASLHRYGTVNLGFFVLSIGLLAAACMLALVWQRFASGVGDGLRGVAAFAVVPLHYLVIGVLAAVGATGIGVAAYLAVSVVTTVAVIALARAFAAAVESRLTGRDGVRAPGVYVGLGVAVAFGCAVALWLLPASRPELLALALTVAGQLAVALGLAARSAGAAR